MVMSTRSVTAKSGSVTYLSVKERVWECREGGERTADCWRWRYSSRGAAPISSSGVIVVVVTGEWLKRQAWPHQRCFDGRCLRVCAWERSRWAKKNSVGWRVLWLCMFTVPLWKKIKDSTARRVPDR